MIILAFLVVAGSCALMIPVMLYVFQLHDKGWTWQYAALFGSMLASTDAVAIIATMKSSKLFTCSTCSQLHHAPVDLKIGQYVTPLQRKHELASNNGYLVSNS